MRDPVNIVCACNANFIMPLCVMLVSLVEHFDPKRDLIIHIISNDASAQDRENVRDSIGMNRPGLEHIAIHWHAISPAMLEKLPTPEGAQFTKDVYARLFIPYLLPETCERAIFIDGDMVVLTDLSELYDLTSDSDVTLHATHDLGIPLVSSLHGVFDYAERGIPSSSPYFNGGLLVLNLKRWREKNLTEQILEYLTRHGNRVILADQGALNAFLYDDWSPLDKRWNQTSEVLFEESWLAAGYSHAEWLQVKNHPYIVHYTGPRKPWNSGRYTPRYSHFYHYLSKTVYAKTTRLPFHPEVLIGFRAYYQLWKGIRKMFPGRFSPPPPVQSRESAGLKLQPSKI